MTPTIIRIQKILFVVQSPFLSSQMDKSRALVVLNNSLLLIILKWIAYVLYLFLFFAIFWEIANFFSTFLLVSRIIHVFLFVIRPMVPCMESSILFLEYEREYFNIVQSLNSFKSLISNLLFLNVMANWVPRPHQIMWRFLLR